MHSIKQPVRILAQAAAALLAVAFTPSISAQWKVAHPGAGGQIQGIAPDPLNPGRFYVMSDVEGCYRTDDWGQNYQYIGFGIHNGATYQIAVDPQVSGRIYLGTQRGVLISDNAGDTWNAITGTTQANNKGFPVYAFAVDQTNSNNVYFANSWVIKDTLYLWGEMGFNTTTDVSHTGVLWYTRNRGGATGQEWQQTTFSSTSTYQNVYSIKVRPGNPNEVYVGAHSGLYRGVYSGGSFSWTKFPEPAGGFHCRGFDFSPDGNYIYASYTTTTSPAYMSNQNAIPPNPTALLWACQVPSTPASVTWVKRSTGLPEGKATGNKFNTEFWNPIVDPVASTGTSHRVIMGTIMGAAGLWEANFTISGGTPNDATWALAFSAHEGGFNYDRGWDTYNTSARQYAFVPRSWYPASRTKSELLVSGDQNLFLSDSTAPGWPKGVLCWSERYSRFVGRTTPGNFPTYRSRGWQSTITWDIDAVDNYLIQAMADNGLVESFDGGYSWTRAHRPFPLSTGKAVHIVKNRTPNIVLAAGGDGFGAGGIVRLHAMELTTKTPSDTWITNFGGAPIDQGIGVEGISSSVGTPIRAYFGSLAIFGNKTHQGLWWTSDIDGLFRNQSDTSLHFQKIWSGDAVGKVMAHPTDNNTVYFKTRQRLGALYRGVYSGSAWTFTQLASNVIDYYVWAHNGTVYLAYVNNASAPDLFLSDNGGTSFIEVLHENELPQPTFETFNGTSARGARDLGGVVGHDNFVYFGVGDRFDNRRGWIYVKCQISGSGTGLTVTWEDWTGQDKGRHDFPIINRARIINVSGKKHIGTAVNGSGSWLRSIEAAPTVFFEAPNDLAYFSASPANFSALANVSHNSGGTLSAVEFFLDGVKKGNGTLTSTANIYGFTYSSVSAGAHELKVVATDTAGKSDSATLNIHVGNRAPIIKITSPANGVALLAPLSFSTTAEAADPDGNPISSVVFALSGPTSQSITDTAAPYTASFSNLPQGTYTVTATATDNQGLGASDVITLRADNPDAEINSTTSAPVIDGALDALWSNANSYTIAKPISGSSTGTSDISGSWRALWDTSSLYLLIDVTDELIREDSGAAAPYQDDSAEIFIDSDFSRGSSYDGVNDFQYVITGSTGTLTETKIANSTTNVVKAVSPKTGGYRIEMKIPWTTLGTTAVSQKNIGLDTQINDDDDGTNRDAKIGWYDATGNAYLNPSLIGRARLVGTSSGTAPAQVTNPSPAHATTNVATNTTLSWDAATSATSYDVYFGTNAAPDSAEFKGNQTGTTYNPGALSNSTTYYWRIDSKNANGTTTGSVWSFSTSAPVLPTITVTASDANASETGPDAGVFTVSRSGSTASSLTVNYAVSGTATSGSDYTAIGTSVTIPAGAASANVTVNPINDTAVESSETVILTVSANAAYTVGSPSNATVTIADNDSVTLPTITVTASDANASETGPDAGVFTVSRSGSTASSLTVNYAVSGTATSGSDYTAIGTSVTIPAGAASANVTVNPINDTAVESSETVILTVSANAAYTVGSPSSATVTIADNDSVTLPTITVTASDANASETGPDAGVFTVSRSGSTASSLTVNYAVSGTATSGSDYTALGTSVTIPAGAASANVTVNPINDTAVESSETVILTVSANAAYTVGSPSNATVTIADNDSAGTPTTVTFTSIGTEDGNVLESGETTNIGGTVSSNDSGTSAIRVGDNAQDRQYKGLLSFDTASIPDSATITAATLTLVRGTVSGTSPFGTHGTCYVDIKGGLGFSDSSLVDKTDFEAAADATQVGTLSTPASNGSSSTAALNATGLSRINKTGKTQLRIYFNLDDNDDAGADFVGFYAGENGTIANRPTLTVTYQ